MGKPYLDGYKSATLCEEIVRRIKKGEKYEKYFFISGRSFTFRGSPREEPWRNGVKEGSQRYIALRNLFTFEELMKTIQDRVLQGEEHAFNEFAWAMKKGEIATMTLNSRSKRGRRL